AAVSLLRSEPRRLRPEAPSTGAVVADASRRLRVRCDLGIRPGLERARHAGLGGRGTTAFRHPRGGLLSVADPQWIPPLLPGPREAARCHKSASLVPRTPAPGSFLPSSSEGH